jgi:glycosyltransferase involved in cell wall biosynthesis
VVSVVVATYNRATFLPRMIDAIMAQDLPEPFELIIVDNGSTDGTEELVKDAISTAGRPISYHRLDANLGPCSRNVGIDAARGRFVAFTDSDCAPDPGWLRGALEGFSEPGIGIVQGHTEASRDRAPLLSHYIVTRKLDGSYSTSNIVYRREAIGDLRFDPECLYWEDVDLGWRVLTSGWKAVYADSAIVRHEVIPLSPMKWLSWPRHFANWPAKAARYPGFRKHLFLRVWVSPIHFVFDLALFGVALAIWQPFALLLGVPYVVEFVHTRGLRGKFPPAKIAAHIAWDFVAFGSLLLGSARSRALVL